MTAKDLLQLIIDGEAGEHIRYAPVDPLKAISLMIDIESRPDAESGGRAFFAALEKAAFHMEDEDV